MIPDVIKTITVVLFIDVVLILSYLNKPYFILGGIFFIDSIMATFIILVLLTTAIMIGYKILKRRKAYYPAKWFTMFLVFNSLINLCNAVFFGEDIAGFLQRLYGFEVFGGFIILQFCLVALNVFLYALLRKAHILIR